MIMSSVSQEVGESTVEEDHALAVLAGGGRRR